MMKTVAVRFRKQLKDTRTLTINDTEIKWHTKTKYLEITLDSHLQFNIHIDEITKMTRRTRAVLCPILHSRNSIPIRAKINTFKMYVRSKITFFGPAWGAQISESNWKKIEAIQNLATKTINGQYSIYIQWYV